MKFLFSIFLLALMCGYISSSCIIHECNLFCNEHYGSYECVAKINSGYGNLQDCARGLCEKDYCKCYSFNKIRLN